MLESNETHSILITPIELTDSREISNIKSQLL